MSNNHAHVPFIINGHCDDWQLFMQPNVSDALLQEKTKVVFIITTAGDRGEGPSRWHYGELGMMKSLRVLLDTAPNPTLEPPGWSGVKEVTINGGNSHQIACSKYKNAVAYFLRLPDGNNDGSGFSANAGQSLLKLMPVEKRPACFRNVEFFNQITTVNMDELSKHGGTPTPETYHGWQDLCDTIGQIIINEARDTGANDSWLNIPSIDIVWNPGDHPDHYATGHAVEDARTCVQKASDCMPPIFVAAFKGYWMIDNVLQPGGSLFPRNQRAWLQKVAMFFAYDQTLHVGTGKHTIEENCGIDYKAWLDRQAYCTNKQW